MEIGEKHFVTKIHPIVRSSSKIPAGVMLSTTGLGAWGFLLLGGSIVWKPRKLPPSVERTRETTAINRHFLDDSRVSLVSPCWTNRTHLESVKTCDVRFQCETAIFGCINNPYPPGNQQISPTSAFLKMMFLFLRWDLLVPWRLVVGLTFFCHVWGIGGQDFLGFRFLHVRHCEVTSGLGVAAAFYAAAKVGMGQRRLCHLTKLLGKQSTVGD